MKLLRAVAFFFLTLWIAVACAEELGYMEVTNCTEWVSMREGPSAGSKRLAKVPLGTLLTNCRTESDEFIYAEYGDLHGYIQAQYLIPSDGMTGTSGTLDCFDDESALRSSGEMLFETESGQNRILAVRSTDGKEVLRVCCYDGYGQRKWGTVTYLNSQDSVPGTDCFIAGTDPIPAIALYNPASGLSLLSTQDGSARWTLSPDSVSFGSGIIHTVASDGTIYLASASVPAPVEISSAGKIVWKAKLPEKDLGLPEKIEIVPEGVRVSYTQGNASVLYSISGSVRSVEKR